MEIFKLLEFHLPKGWVWEAGNNVWESGVPKRYWAQAIGPETEYGKHPEFIGYGETLEEAVHALVRELVADAA